MRHRVYGKHFGRDKDERKNLFKGLVHSLVTSGTIVISETKAKAIKGLVDKVINAVKKDLKVAGQPLVQAFLNDKILKQRVIQEILPKLGTKTSGYTRVIRLGTRVGDQTTIVKMSLIGAEELKPLEKESQTRSQKLAKEAEKPKVKTAVAPKKTVQAKTAKINKRSAK